MDISPKVESGTETAPPGPVLSADVPPLEPRVGEEGRARVLARLLETTSQPFFGADVGGRITCANIAFAALTGEPRTELVGRLISDYTTPEARGRLARGWAEGRPFRIEIEVFRRDGGSSALDLAVEVDRGAEGEPAGFCVFVTDRSQRVQVERALRESEDRFRRLYNDAPVGYRELDVEGRILNINQTGCELFGYGREELVGRPLFDFVTEEGRDVARKSFFDRVAERSPLRPFDRTVVARDGRKVEVTIEERYRRDARGKVVGLLQTMTDVTEAKRAGAALMASQRRARALFEGIDEAVFVHALDGRILDANPAASRLLGYSRDEMLGMTTSQIDDPDFAAGYEARLSQQMSRGHLACEGRHRTKDGRVIPVEITTSSIQLDDQRAVLAVIRDISERLALEATRKALADSELETARAIAAKNAELTLSEARYRRLTEGSLDGVIAAQLDGTVTLYNSAAETMFGSPASEVLGRPLSVLMPKAFSPGPDRPFEAVAARLVGKTVEVPGLRRGSEEFPLELSVSEVGRGEDRQLILSVRDQTERQRMRDMLARSEKLASIGLLSAGVAHEINNPLAYVANNLAVLERDLGSVMEMVVLYESARPAIVASDPQTLAKIDDLAEDFDWAYVRDNLPRMIARTREGVQRVATIVAGMRSLARTAPHKMEAARVTDLVGGAVEMIRGRLRRRNITIEVDLGGVPTLQCVPPQISQVVLNLLMNAAQSVESTGRTEGGLVRLNASVEGEMMVLAVSDNGTGIDPEHIPRLFDPFFTTKSVGEGTGLGLSICHGIVTGHGGRIEVRTEPGKGTTFRVLLPLKPS